MKGWLVSSMATTSAMTLPVVFSIQVQPCRRNEASSTTIWSLYFALYTWPTVQGEERQHVKLYWRLHQKHRCLYKGNRESAWEIVTQSRVVRRVFGVILADHGSPDPLEAAAVSLPLTRFEFLEARVMFPTQVVAHVTSESCGDPPSPHRPWGPTV